MKIITLLFFFQIASHAQKLNIDLLQKKYKQKMLLYLDKQGGLENYYSINEKGIFIYASLTDKNKQNAEFSIKWDCVDSYTSILENYNPDFSYAKYCKGKYTAKLIAKSENKKKYNENNPLPLKGIKIAIDPGHIGGDSTNAQLERKYLKIYIDSSKSTFYELIEGNLTMQTANLLTKKLIAMGADVFITRNENNCSFNITYNEWKNAFFDKCIYDDLNDGQINKTQYAYYKNEAHDNVIYQQLFLQDDLKNRARLINEFHPHLTIIIHYNVDEENIGWKKTTTKNYNMTFVPGAFMKTELRTKYDRFELLRLLLTNDIESSITAADYFTNSFQNILDVPNALPESAKYLKESCMPTNKSGVFCRNLALTRLVHGPIVYGETLYQDNLYEIKLLTQPPELVKGVLLNPRVAKVADAYYSAVLDYFQNN